MKNALATIANLLGLVDSSFPNKPGDEVGLLVTKTARRVLKAKTEDDSFIYKISETVYPNGSVTRTSSMKAKKR